jgi:site-specific recombinase XerD
MGKVVRLSGLVPLAEDLDAAIDAFIVHCEAKNLSPRTVEFYRDRLASFKRYVAETAPQTAPKDFTARLIGGFIDRTRRDYSAATAVHNLNVIRIFIGFLLDDGVVQENPALSVERPRKRKRLIQTLSMEDVAAMLATCGKDFYGVRDRAIMLTLLDTGLRVSELTSLRLDDVSWSEQLLLVLGKGNKERRVPFGAMVRDALGAYIRRRGRVPGQELVFISHFGTALDRFRVRDLLERRANAAGIPVERVSCHKWRHTFAKQWLLNGGDAFSLKSILGHSTMEMVSNYVNLAQAEVRSVHARFSPADRLRTEKRVTSRTRIK